MIEMNVVNVMKTFLDIFPIGDDSLAKLFQENVRKKSGADCLVGLNGGKDITCSLIKLYEKTNM